MRRRTWIAVIGIGAAGIGDLAANAAPLPKSWQSHLWVAWPVLAVMLLVVIATEIAAHAAERRADAPAGGVTVQNVIASGGSFAAGAAGGGSVYNCATPPSAPNADAPRPIEPPAEPR